MGHTKNHHGVLPCGLFKKIRTENTDKNTVSFKKLSEQCMSTLANLGKDCVELFAPNSSY